MAQPTGRSHVSFQQTILLRMQGAIMRFALAGGMLAAALIAGAPAMAADMPLKAAPPPVLAPTWTGTYIGINGGWGSGTSRQSLAPPASPRPGTTVSAAACSA
jgi:hypothetical protein